MFDTAALLRDTFIAAVEQHEEIGSTSDRALELCRSETPLSLPMLVIARRQTAGRGRGAARWYASDGGLLFTLILDPKAAGVSANRLPAVPLAMATAVTQAATRVLKQPAAVAPLWVKWPNDVYAGGRKLAGVLTESPLGPGGAQRLAVGVGVNVNNRFDHAPEEVRSKGVSVSELRGSEITQAERQTLLVDLLNRFASQLAQLEVGFSLPPCPLDGCKVGLETSAGLLRGEYVGIDAQGALLLRCDGRTQRVVSGTELRLL